MYCDGDQMTPPRDHLSKLLILVLKCLSRIRKLNTYSRPPVPSIHDMIQPNFSSLKTKAKELQSNIL